MSGTTIGGITVRAVTGDLTQQEVDAIVNAANKDLKHGGGVAGAIVGAGGPAIQEESDAWTSEHGRLGDGEAVVTTGGDLPADHVIHVAGPVYDDERADNESRLRAAVRAALDAAVDEGATSIAFPAISAGIYGYPADEATAILADEVAAFAREHEKALEEVRLVGLDDETTRLFADGIERASAG